MGYTFIIDKFISVINPQGNVVEERIIVGVEQGIDNLAYSPIVNKIFAVNRMDGNNSVGSISVINPSDNSISSTMNVGIDARDAVYSPTNGSIYVSNYDSQNVFFLKNL